MTLGGAMRDIFIYYSDEQLAPFAKDGHTYFKLEAGRKMEADRIELHSGGGAVNTAVSFSRMGFDALIITAVGQDDYAQAIRADLMQNKVDVSAIKVVSNDMTGVSFIIPFPGGERTVMLYRGANRHLTPADIPDHLLSGRAHIHISSLAGQSSQMLPHVAQKAHQAGLTISINPGTSQVCRSIDSIIESLPYVSTLIVNSFEAGVLAKALLAKGAITLDSALPKEYEHYDHRLFKPLEQDGQQWSIYSMLRALSLLGISTLVITDGAHGVYLAHNNEILFHPSIACTVVSTLGAGDAFASAFVASRLRKHPLRESLVMGILNSASVICHEDTQTGLLTQEALEQRLIKQGLGDIQSYKIS